MSGTGFCNSLLLPQCESWVSQKQHTTPVVYLPVPFIEIWQSLWMGLSSATCSPPLPFMCTLQRELRCCKQTASWSEELRIDVLHSSFLSGKREDDKILPEMNGAIHTSQSCCFKLHLCFKPYSSPSCIVTQLRTPDCDEQVISHLSEKSSV